MIFKYLAALIAVALMLAYLLPPVFKLKELELGIAIVFGLILMVIDLWQSLQSEED